MQRHLSNFDLQFCSFTSFTAFPGLPLHWTDPATGKVSPGVLERMLPRGQAELFFARNASMLVPSGFAGEDHGMRVSLQRCRRP